MAEESMDDSWILSARLGHAIYRGELEHVRMYIEQGADVNRQCFTIKYREIYPLHLACRRGHEEIMEELLKAGAHPNQVLGRWSKPAMLFAAEKRVLTLSMLRCLISHGADVDFRDDYTRTILHYLACGQFNDTRGELLSAVKLVLDNGASFYAEDKCTRTPLYDACKCGNIDLVKLFIAEGADVTSDIGGMTMLTGAAYSGNIDMFDFLLNAGANKHMTPRALLSPCLANDHAMIGKILDTCDVHIKSLDRENWTILHYVFGQCTRDVTSETVRLLLDRGADVRAVTNTGNTALHYAVKHYCGCNKIRQLLSYNPPLNIMNNKNQTPLVKVSRCLINHYSQSRQRVAYSHDHRVYDANLYQAGLLAFKMLVTAGAKITADVKQNLNQFHIKHPEAQIPDYEIRSTRSLKELCRFVIRGTIPVPVDVSLCKLPIPKPLQNYLNFPELDPLVDEYLNIIATDNDDDDDDEDDYGYSYNAFDPFEGENDDDF